MLRRLSVLVLALCAVAGAQLAVSADRSSAATGTPSGWFTVYNCNTPGFGAANDGSAAAMHFYNGSQAGFPNTRNINGGNGCPATDTGIRGTGAGVHAVSCSVNGACNGPFGNGDYSTNSPANAFAAMFGWTGDEVRIMQAFSHWAYDTAVPEGSSADRYPWWVQAWTYDDGNWRIYEDWCTNPGSGLVSCTTRYVEGMTYSASQMGNAAGVKGIYYGTQCMPTTYSTCSANYINNQYRDYAVRTNIRTLHLKVRDLQAPAYVQSSGGALTAGGWLSANVGGASKGVTMYAAEPTYGGSGIRRARLEVDGGVVGTADYLGQCARIDSDVIESYHHGTPCPAVQSTGFAANIAGLSGGAHNGRLVAEDVSGNWRDYPFTFYVDNVPPPNGGACGVSVNEPAPVRGTAAPDGKRYLKGTTNSITGAACDPLSGIASSEIQVSVNGGAWASLGNSGSASAPRANFNTTSYAEGTRVQFRAVGWDNAGNVAGSSATGNFYIDNTAQQLSASALSMEGFSTGGETPTPLSLNAWTNKLSVRLKWNPATVSPEAGSPIDGFYYRYNNGCVSTSPILLPGGNTANNVVVDNRNYAAPNSQTLEQHRSDEQHCGQGAHLVYVWPVDWAGNQTSTGSRYLRYYYDSVAPDSPTQVKVSPSTWSNSRNFSMSWTNPANPKVRTPATPAGKFSPLAQIRYRVADDDLHSWTDCLGSGQQCDSKPLSVPDDEPGGAYPVKIWVRDAAGNQDESNSEIGVLYFNDELCVIN